MQVLFQGKAVEALIARTILSLSPVALAAFLDGVAVPHLINRIEERFADEGDNAVGGPWKPLSAGTNQIREQLGYPREHPINVRSGELFSFLTHGGNTNPEPWGASATIPDREPIGELENKMVVAQVGGTQPGGYKPTPARPVLAMDLMDLSVVLTGLQGWVSQGRVR